MSAAFLTVTALAVVANLAAAYVDFVRAQWVVDNMIRYGVPMSWLYPLGFVKTAGALGLLAGLAVPALGIAAAAGLVLYYVGAVATVVRVRAWADFAYPTAFLLLSVVLLAMRV